MIVNTRKAATSSRRHATLSKRAVKNTDGVYRLPFFFQCNMDIKDVIAVLILRCSPDQIRGLVTRGQVLDIVQDALTAEGIYAIKNVRIAMESPDYQDVFPIAKTQIIRLFPDFFPKFARPRK